VVALALALAGAPGAAADAAALLATEWGAAVERAHLVLGAQEAVDVATFILGDEPFSLTSMALLRDAARRGVEVRLLVDAQWNKLPAAVEAHLLAEGVLVRRYHPLRWRRPGWIARRMHDKLLVVDGGTMIVGGRNVESPYFGLGHQLRRRDYIDLDVVVEGGAAAAAAAYFEALWGSGEVAPSRARATPGERAAAAAELDRHHSWLEGRIAALRGTPEGAPAARREVGPVRFLHDPPGRKGDAPGVAEALLELLDAAEESVVIESPYLVPTRGCERGLERALGRGVRVRILTNSLATTDNLWPQAAYAGDKRGLVARGVELWETTGEESLHTKAALIDGTTVVVGTFNLDPRSQRLNTELAVALEDPVLAAELAAWMDGHLAGAARIGPDGRPAGYAERYPGVPRCKVWKLRLLRPLAALARGQL
jgi:putative cardiolipin synthase